MWKNFPKYNDFFLYFCYCNWLKIILLYFISKSCLSYFVKYQNILSILVPEIFYFCHIWWSKISKKWRNLKKNFFKEKNSFFIFYLYFAESEVAELIHQAIEKGLRAARVHSKLALFRKIVALLYVLGMFALGNAHHPQELIYIVARIADETAKNDEHIVHIQLLHDLVCFRLIRGHCLAHHRYMTVIPCIIVH